jgi:hypothetical protein
MRKILLGERVALNILARCSGIATKYVNLFFSSDIIFPHVCQEIDALSNSPPVVIKSPIPHKKKKRKEAKIERRESRKSG